jgi:NADH dehydrogenase FAD-containing subunit
MTGIDRGEKQILLASGQVLPYDHLILAPGLQVQSTADAERVWFS